MTRRNSSRVPIWDRLKSPKSKKMVIGSQSEPFFLVVWTIFRFSPLGPTRDPLPWHGSAPVPKHVSPPPRWLYAWTWRLCREVGRVEKVIVSTVSSLGNGWKNARKTLFVPKLRKRMAHFKHFCIHFQKKSVSVLRETSKNCILFRTFGGGMGGQNLAFFGNAICGRSPNSKQISSQSRALSLTVSQRQNIFSKPNDMCKTQVNLKFD